MTDEPGSAAADDRAPQSRSSRDPGEKSSPRADNLSVLARVRDLLGFEPGVQLRNLTSESSRSITPGQEEGKYVIEREIGKGGMGAVFLAFDRDLRRHVAVKVIQERHARNPDLLARFVEEAQVTGQLEHPGIPPVHELAINQNQEVFFTLKLLRGRTLKEIIRDLHIGRRDIREKFSRTRLLQTLLAVANAVHFAHEKGVIHRDIKPENIMIGDYGEVQLMDWGLAKVVGRPERDEALEHQVETVRTDQQMVTRHDSIHGTLQYMSPEQAQGRSELLDRRSDVYALGATLYEILTFLPPKTGSAVNDLLEESRLGLVIPPRQRAPKQRIPPALEEICMQALEYHPEDRYQSALELAEALQVYLDGTLEEEGRRSESDTLLDEALKVVRDHERAKSAELKVALEIDELDRAAGNHPAAEDKKKLRALRVEKEEKEIAAAQMYTQAQTLLSSALAANPENARARQALGNLYLERLLRADKERNTADSIFYRGLVEQVNDGSFDRILEGHGSLVLDTDPGEAKLTLQRYEERDAVLVSGVELASASGELNAEDLPMGSYLVVVEKEGFFPTRYPVLVGRNQDIRVTVKLYREDEIPEGFAYVPAGPFLMYGDPNILSSFKQPCTVHLPGFAAGVFPVTCGEYLEFLNDLLEHDADGAHRHCPRESGEAGFLWEVTDGRYELPAPGRYPWHPRLPVFGVSFEDAEAYCRFRSRRDGRRYDLLTEVEWEKAGKGVDGRYYSWGNHFDNDFANNYHARQGCRGVVEVDTYPQDCSPFGVRGMVGNVSDWCYLEDTDPSEMVAARGGNWALTSRPCRLSARRGTNRNYVSDRHGFRLKLILEENAGD